MDEIIGEDVAKWVHDALYAVHFENKRELIVKTVKLSIFEWPLVYESYNFLTFGYSKRDNTIFPVVISIDKCW